MSSTTGNFAAANVLGAKDINVTMGNTPEAEAAGKESVEGKGSVKSMEFHRQVLQSKMEDRMCDDDDGDDNRATTAAAAPLHHKAVSKLTQKDVSGNNYVSPSDEIMSPCTAKLNAFRNKQVGKYVLALSPPPFSTFSAPPPLITRGCLLLINISPTNRVKPKSLFAQASTKRMRGSEGLFGNTKAGTHSSDVSAN